MINLGLVEIKGVDVVLQGGWKLGDNWTFDSRLSYTYQKAQDFTDKLDEDTYGGQISYIPWHSGSAILNAEYKSWELNYSFIYIGERYGIRPILRIIIIFPGIQVTCLWQRNSIGKRRISSWLWKSIIF